MQRYFLFLAPIIEIVPIAKSVLEEMGAKNWVVDYGSNQRGVEVARHHIAQGARVIVSRGITYRMLARLDLPVPVIDMGLSPYELLQIIADSPVEGKKVGVIGIKFGEMEKKFCKRCFSCEIHEVPLDVSEDVEKLVRQAHENGAEVLVGGFETQEYGSRLGLKTVRLISGRSTIANAVSRAEEIDAARRREELRVEQMHAILDFCFDGIMVTDSAGVIIMVNKTALEMLGIHQDAALGRPRAEVCPFVDWEHVGRAAGDNMGKVVKIGNRHLVHTIVPVLANGEFMGTVMSFQYAKNIEAIESKVRRNLYLSGHVASFRFENITTVSPAMQRVLEQAKKYAAVESTILLIGETGTGKEMIAQSIHNASGRKQGPFVAVNCASIPETLLESELFGYAEGAFTGARKEGKKGYFELANGGTLFLDEIGEISPKLQSSLLRVLQQKEITRVGGDAIVPIDARIVAATHQDLHKLSLEGKFRLDLFHRLNILRLHLPSLRERKEDIPVLTMELLQRKARELSLRPAALSEEVVRAFSEYPWSGNVRELEAVVERILALKAGEAVTLDDLEDFFLDKNFAASAREPTSAGRPLERAEQQVLRELLAKHGGRKDAMCRELGISYSTLWRRLKKHSLS